MKILLWFGVAYLVVVTAATAYSANEPGTTPISDMIASLPSPGLLVEGSLGSSNSGALVNGVSAVALWFFAVRK